ncbi:hypothetical protein A5784_15740 [Mycobacterium sp. 852013-50091_SCH5140682]|uniref:hypothetical protein n=1 Tax=Mycobacterium sp. 852013-50091_SCH5140682 TaxID=1834109 RepID=UPI0007EB37C4|nr:hypothetical protein [Mycobacterium sp. 852013-50091_SCH5140682]OBC02368.1 hypothetical protein A5784_15740 [Mycobacterium sp. 852013-50091_SCH5140682]
MKELRQDIPALATPLNVLLVLWMVVGRGLFVPMGWMALFGVLASPILLFLLWLTTRMMRQRGRRELTSGQAWAQIVLWAAMLVFGLACVDGGDSPTPFPSVLMKLLGEGPAMKTVSGVLFAASVFVGIGAWIVLHGKLTRDIATAQPAQQPYPYPGHPPSQTGPRPLT